MILRYALNSFGGACPAGKVHSCEITVTAKPETWNAVRSGKEQDSGGGGIMQLRLMHHPRNISETSSLVSEEEKQNEKFFFLFSIFCSAL